MDRFSELAKDIMGWITVTSANKGVESLDVIVRSILPSPVESRFLNGPSVDSGTSCWTIKFAERIKDAMQ